MFKRSLAAAALLLALAGSTHAQTVLPPWPYNPTLGTSPVQVLPVDPARKRIIFHNPSATASIAFCPSDMTRAGVAFSCAVNGAGGITLLPYGTMQLDVGTAGGSPLAMGASWFGVASAANTPATLFEFE